MSRAEFFLYQRFLVLSGVVIIPFLGVLIALLATTKVAPAKNSLIPLIAFWTGTTWIILFFCMLMYGTKLFVGIGLGLNFYVMLAIVTGESCLLGILTFNSTWRLLGLIPLLVGAPLIVAWVFALFVSRP